MNKIKTIWLRDFYDPLAPAPEPIEESTNHHLVYAAMLDGLRGREPLEEYTGISCSIICKLQIDLARAGYIRLGKHNSRNCYVLYEDENTYKQSALTPDEVFEIGELAKTHSYTHADLSIKFNVPRWTISDALQGRKQYRENRV